MCEVKMKFPSESSMTPSLNTMPSSPTPSPPKRPRLSLQIKAAAMPQTRGKSVTALKTDFTDPFSPTAFNTLSNAYAVAIETCSPRSAKPVPALKASVEAPSPSRPPFPRLQTSSSDASSGEACGGPARRLQTPGPFHNVTPDSPHTVRPTIPPTAKDLTPAYPFTFTPPQSAHPREATGPRVFTFAPSHLGPTSTAITPLTPSSNPSPLRRRATIASPHSAPYTHPRSLRSILRNSPLSPHAAPTPASPRRISIRLANTKRVGYNTPLTQTIVTNKYTQSHIDLLAEEASPYTPTDSERDDGLEAAFACAAAGDETRDGGRTPGPHEGMRRRMASFGDEPQQQRSAAPSQAVPSAGAKKDARKRKRREKKRQWIWTIGDTAEEEAEEAGDAEAEGSAEEAERRRSRRYATDRIDTPVADRDVTALLSPGAAAAVVRARGIGVSASWSQRAVGTVVVPSMVGAPAEGVGVGAGAGGGDGDGGSSSSRESSYSRDEVGASGGLESRRSI